VISAIVLILVALISYAVFGISASWAFTLLVWAVGLVVCLAVRMLHKSAFSVVVACVLTLFVLVLHFMDILPVKPYKRFFAAIQPGMSEQQVLGLLSKEFQQAAG